MKTKILTIAILYALTFGALFACPTKAQITRTTANVAMPSLSGEAATEFLKRDGSYEQLLEAVNKAGDNEAGAIQEYLQTKKLLASDGGGLENFGRTVAVNGDTAVISSRKPPNGPNLQQGAVYVFERNFGGANAWGEVKKLIAPDGEMNEGFGFSLAISEERTLSAGRLVSRSQVWRAAAGH